MTPREISFATGVNISTVYAHLNRGTLPGSVAAGRWTISPRACLAWAGELWEQGRILQLPPQYSQHFIEHFKIT